MPKRRPGNLGEVLNGTAPLTNSVTGIAVALGMALGNDLRDGHPATAEQGKRVARLLERTELHREAGDRLRRKGCFEEIFGRKSTRFRLACRGDGSWSRLAHESTFAGPT